MQFYHVIWKGGEILSELLGEGNTTDLRMAGAWGVGGGVIEKTGSSAYLDYKSMRRQQHLWLFVLNLWCCCCRSAVASFAATKRTLSLHWRLYWFALTPFASSLVDSIHPWRCIVLTSSASSLVDSTPFLRHQTVIFVLSLFISYFLCGAEGMWILFTYFFF